MDIWLALMGNGGPEESIIGAYSTEELAAKTAERASPGDWYTIHAVLDEEPGWIDVYRRELEDEQELQDQPDADGAHSQPATQDAREPS
jgi:hypothetical protein